MWNHGIIVCFLQRMEKRVLIYTEEWDDLAKESLKVNITGCVAEIMPGTPTEFYHSSALSNKSTLLSSFSVLWEPVSQRGMYKGVVIIVGLKHFRVTITMTQI